MNQVKLKDNEYFPLVVMRPKAWQTWFIIIGYLIFILLAVGSRQVIWITFFGALGFFQTLYQLRHFDIGENGITYRNFLGMKYIAWSEIVSVRYSKAGGWSGRYSVGIPSYFFIDAIDKNQMGVAKSLSIPFVSFTNVPEFAKTVLTKVDRIHIDQLASEKLAELAAQEKRNVKSRN